MRRGLDYLDWKQCDALEMKITRIKMRCAMDYRGR